MVIEWLERSKNKTDANNDSHVSLHPLGRVGPLVYTEDTMLYRQLKRPGWHASLGVLLSQHRSRQIQLHQLG